MTIYLVQAPVKRGGWVTLNRWDNFEAACADAREMERRNNRAPHFYRVIDEGTAKLRGES
jgi:hypothetical protein